MNIPLDPHTFDINRQRAKDYLNTHERLYCFDGFAGWDAKYRLKVRVICSRPSHALFMHTMLIRPTHAELDAFGAPDFVIYNAGAFPANRLTTGMGSTTSIDLSLEDKELVILGTEYAGEMKKGVFTVANYFAPKRGVLSMHCSATADKETGRSSLLFGLSGTGKTTLSADPKRHLIGDDEHCWSDDGIFNIEGGCYAKAINLTPESEPDIFQALRFGAVLENVVLDDDQHVDGIQASPRISGRLSDRVHSKCQNPLHGGAPERRHFSDLRRLRRAPARELALAGACDVHFISGYTAKVAGTEMGVTEPQATMLRRTVFAVAPQQICRAARREDARARVACVAGKYRLERRSVWGREAHETGQYSRYPRRYPQRRIQAGAKTVRDPVFGFDVVTECPGVPAEILLPRESWADKAALRCYGTEAGRSFHKELCDVQRRRQRRGEGPLGRPHESIGTESL